MKAFNILIFFIGVSIYTNAQVNLNGKWKVNCALEKTNEGTMHVCDICPSMMLANNTAIINDFEWEISSSSLKFVLDQKELEVTYNWNSGTNTLSFKYNDKDYSFKAMILSDPFIQILKADSGEILYLKKLM